MPAERFARARELFQELVDLPAQERAAALAEACGDDGGLRREVEALFAADASPPPFLDGHAAELAAPAFFAEDLSGANESAAGRRLGPWQLEEEIGRGGMSRVFRAERVDGAYRQTAAVKLMQPFAADRREVERRFAAERQILATLDHPSIAKILDGGVAPSGEPYLVMEHVDGRDLTAYCQAANADLGRRLELFGEVCEAVQHAHQRLVVHRDLKPGNVLVTGEGAVKLVDFGIAKLLDPAAGGASPMAATRTGLLLLTPQYAAPEQVRGGPITTATDVYALGVVLYELLVGERPYRLEGRSPAEVERLICDDEPDRPSTAVTRPATGEPAWATTKDLAVSRLQGDLDVIVMKALAKDPARRYASVAELAEDLSRYREGLPISARPATFSYRARRFAGRHRWAVAAAALALLAAGLFTAALAFQRGEALRQRDLARTEATKATEVADFLLGLFEASDPQEALGQEITARQLLERGAERTEAMAGQPLVQAQMLDLMGRVYDQLGEYGTARELLEEALEIRIRELGPSAEETAFSKGHLANLAFDEGRFEEAARLQGESLEALEALRGPDDLQLTLRRVNLGAVLRRAGDLAAAENQLVESHRIVSRHPEADPQEKAFTAGELSLLRRQQGNLEGAEALVREALKLRLEAHGPLHPEVVIQQENLATLLRGQGRSAEAEEALREVLEAKVRLYGEDHDKTNLARSQLAITLGMQGRYEEAEVLFREVLEQRRRIFGPEHPAVARSLGNLAMLAEKRAHLEEAERLREEALELKIRLLGAEHPEVAAMLGNQAALLSRQGRYEEAEALGRRSLAIERKHFGDEHPEVAASLLGLAVARRGQGDLEEAERLSRESLAMRRKLLPAGHPQVGTGLLEQGSLLVEKDDLKEAEGAAREALEVLRLSADAPNIAESHHLLGDVLERRGELEEAEEQWLAAFSIRRELLDDGHPDLAATARRLAELYERTGRSEEAAAYRHLFGEPGSP